MTNIKNYSDLGSKRLHDYGYSQPGAYFVTICTANRRCIFGEIMDGEMQLNKHGMIVAEQWAGLPSHYPRVSIDEFVIMPNHIHGIICLSGASQTSVGAGFQPAHIPHPTDPKHGIPEIIRGFKTYSSLTINRLRGTSGEPVWQRNYYEHIVRDEKDLAAVRKYIVENPLKWELDPENPVVRDTVAASHSGLKTRAYGRR